MPIARPAARELMPTVSPAKVALQTRGWSYANDEACSQVRVAGVSRVIGCVHLAVDDHRCDQAWASWG